MNMRPPEETKPHDKTPTRLPSTRANGTRTAGSKTSAALDPPVHGDTNMADAASSTEAGHDDNPKSEMDCFGMQASGLIKLIQRLETLSIDSTIQSLPKFVVVGDQSHGKSSIVEAVCDIAMPRDAGTCTRCPFQITTTGSKTGSSWECKVSLSYRFAYKPRSSVGNKESKSDWTFLDSPTAVEFAVVTDRNQLEEILRRAQRAILNPSVAPEEFLRAEKVNAATGLSFSPNIIRLDIQAAGLSELSFVDLPGAVNVYDSDPTMVKFLQALIKSYLSDAKALVLVAVACNQDMELCTTYRYIEETEAKSRCMGVLTKPDLITKGNQQVPRILNGEIYKLGHGWYVTKQLSDEELEDSIGHSEARQREEAFFANCAPWNTSVFHTRSHFGTRQIQKALSEKLAHHIGEELPTITSRVQTRLDQVEAQLEQFPEQAKAPCQTVANEIYRLDGEIKDGLSVWGNTTAFRNQYRAIIAELRTQLINVCPKVILSTPGFESSTISIDDDDDVDMEQTPSKSRKLNNGSSTPSQAQSTPSRKQHRTPQTPKTPASKSKNGDNTSVGKSLPLDALDDILDRASVSGLPDDIHPRTTNNFILECLQPWEKIMLVSLKAIERLLGVTLLDSMEKTLAPRRETQLWKGVSLGIDAQLRESVVAIRERCLFLFSCEMSGPEILNPAWDSLLEGTERSLQADRNKIRIDEHFDELQSRSKKMPSEEERKKKLADADWMAKTLGEDPYAREVKWVAKPLAYYKIAATRFVETIAMHVERGLIHELQTKIRTRLETELRVTETEYCAQLLAEDPERERQRCQLVAEKAKLVQALEELNAVPTLRSYAVTTGL